MLYELDDQLIVLATETPARVELLLRLVPDIHFKMREQFIPPSNNQTLATDHLKGTVDQAIAWCGNYLPKDYADKYKRMTIIAAASRLEFNNRVICKGAESAHSQIAALAGSVHSVRTYLRVVSLSPDLHSHWERAEFSETELCIVPMSDEEIDAYLVSPEVAALEREASWFRPDSPLVSGLNGSDSNVLGLPLSVLGKIFSQLRES